MMVNSKAFAYEIAASDLEVVGQNVVESYLREPVSQHYVPASEERYTLQSDPYLMGFNGLGGFDDRSCYCCCCTGDCRLEDEYLLDSGWTAEDEERYQEESERIYGYRYYPSFLED